MRFDFMKYYDNKELQAKLEKECEAPNRSSDDKYKEEREFSLQCLYHDAVWMASEFPKFAKTVKTPEEQISICYRTLRKTYCQAILDGMFLGMKCAQDSMGGTQPASKQKEKLPVDDQ